MSQIAVKERKAPLLSSFACKQIMVVTGFIFVAFVTVHMFGNLKVYFGAESFNHYAAWLREVGYPLIPKKGILWALRIVLVLSLISHMTAGIILWWRGRKSRGKFLRKQMKGELSYFARWMLPTGLTLFVFIVVHLLDLTIGLVFNPQGFRHADADGTVYAYQNLILSFSRPWMAAFYVIVMLLMAMHIWHGWRTMLQDFGATGRRFRYIWTFIGGLLALGIVFGNASIPVLVLAGVLT